MPEKTDTCNFVFFFQAEDGIRDKLVTGVQTCALPISDECPDGHPFSSVARGETHGCCSRFRSYGDGSNLIFVWAAPRRSFFLVLMRCVFHVLPSPMLRAPCRKRQTTRGKRLSCASNSWETAACGATH